MKKLLSAVLLSGVLAVGVAPAAPAHADGADAYGKRCNPDRFKERYRVENLSVAPKVTYQKSYQLGPHEQWRTSREITLNRQTTIKASMSYKSSAGGSLSLPGKLLGELRAETSLSFQGAGTANRSKVVRTTEERRFGNPDNRNRKLIFYRGITKANGQFTRYACFKKYEPGQSYGPFKVHIYYGKFQTWTDHVGLSHLLCGRKATGRLANEVRVKYCPL